MRIRELLGKTGLSVLMVLGLAACAYSPQQIKLQPVLMGDLLHYGAGRALNVTAQDQRVNKVLGSRGGVYAQTSLISLANDASSALLQASLAALAAQGFQVNGANAGAPEFTVILDTLDYRAPPRGMAGKLSLETVLRLEVSRDGEIYKGRYQNLAERTLVLAPDAQYNQQLINEQLGVTLRRLFEDPKLREFLR